MWPFLTAHVTGVSNVNLRRSGTGYDLNGRNDWMTIFDCFTYGHLYGFRVRGDASNTCLLRCQADHTGTPGYTAAGFEIRDTANSISMIGCTAISHSIGLMHSSTSSTPNSAMNCAFANQDACIDHLGGNLRTSGCQLLAGACGVRTNAAIREYSEDNNFFTGISMANYNLNTVRRCAVRINGRGPALTYAGTVTASSGTITSAASTITYYPYENAGLKWVRAEISVIIATNGTGAGSVLVALPFTSARQLTFTGSREVAGGDALLLKVNAGSATLTITKYDNGYPGANGVTFTGVVDIPLP